MARGVNKVILIGNLGKDPEIQNFDKGVKKAAFSLATSETYRNREGVEIEQTRMAQYYFVAWFGRSRGEIPEKRIAGLHRRAHPQSFIRKRWPETVYYRNRRRNAEYAGRALQFRAINLYPGKQ